jgi:hypothetical protein
MRKHQSKVVSQTTVSAGVNGINDENNEVLSDVDDEDFAEF